jgi:hypothetical protein
MLELCPMSLTDAYTFIVRNHRHHGPPQGALFAIGCAISQGSEPCGCVVIGRPVARRLDNGWTAEVTRCCTDGTKNACSLLYAAAWRACRAMGYRRLVTFTLKSEPGTSLRAAGWRVVSETPGRSWSVPSRPRVDKHPLQQRLRWEPCESITPDAKGA